MICICGPRKPLCSYCRELAVKLKTGGAEECAICQVIDGKRGNHSTHRICVACSLEDANDGWKARSDLEFVQGDTETVALAEMTAGEMFARVEHLFGGPAKKNTELVHAVVAAACETKMVRRRRRNANGKPLRGWTEKSVLLTQKEVAAKTGASQRQVRNVIRRVFSN